MDPSQIIPIGDRVVVQRDKAKAETAGGLALPDHSRENPRFGTIIAIGPGALRPMPDDKQEGALRDRFPLQAKVGDRVLLPYMGEAILLDASKPESEVVVCQEGQLLAILPE